MKLPYFLSTVFFLLKFAGLSKGESADPCYYVEPVGYPMIGNCIPFATCKSNMTVPHACPSYPLDFTCCFDEDFPGRESRGAWIATVNNIDWPPTGTTNGTVHEEALRSLIDVLHSVNINAVYFQVRPMGDAMYNSSIEPWSHFLTGVQGRPPTPFWDPLAFLIDYAHSKNIEVHAWINPYRANVRNTTDGLADNHMAVQFPQYAYAYSTYIWMDPGAEVIQNRTYSVAVDLVTRYDLDGLHMDDYFYPYPDENKTYFPDNATYAEYIETGGNLSAPDWRRDNVNKLVRRLNEGLHQIKPWLKFSIAPFGIYRAGHPEGMPPPISGFDQYEDLYSDPKLWFQQGWVDIMQPQLYWPINQTAQSYPVLLDWWIAPQQNTQGRFVMAGNALYRVFPDHNWPLEELKEQARISRSLHRRLALSWGNVWFSAKYFRNETVADFFKEEIYQFPSLQPLYPWLISQEHDESLK